MTPRTLTFRIVTPDGVALEESGVDFVVLRRQEPRFELGSEIAIFPLHAPLLVRLAAAPVRYRKGAATVHLAVGSGFAEVMGDQVLIVTPRCQPMSAPESGVLTSPKEPLARV